MHNSNFCHLHNHSYFSALDGLPSPDQYAKIASNMGFKHLGLTDHGSVSGLIAHQDACKKYGIHPVLGMEGYIVPKMHVKEKGAKNAHINFLVQNSQGWHTLMNLMTTANNTGFYYRPRMDFDLLLNTDLSGLFITTACAGSFITLDGGMDFFWKLYNKIGDNLLLEIMPHRIEAQEKLHMLLGDIVDKDNSLESQLISTNDCHYASEEDTLAQEVLLAINSRRKWDDPKRFSFGFDGLHMRSASEMQIEFKKQNHFDMSLINNSIINTVNIAERCEFTIPKSDISLPYVPSVPKVKSEEEFAYEIALKGYKDIFGEELEDGEYKERLDFEFELLKKKGFIRYFLLVWDLLEYCKKDSVPYGPGRGCFTPKSKVITTIGNKKIVKNICDIEVGKDRVISHDKTSNVVVNRFEYDIDEEVIEIEVEDGRIIECTIDHKIMTKDGWKEAQNLNYDDEILDWRR